MFKIKEMVQQNTVKLSLSKSEIDAIETLFFHIEKIYQG